MNGDWEHRIEKIEKTTNSMQADVTEIKLALIGSEKIGLKGLATRVKDTECYINKDRKQKYMIRGGVIVLGVLWGAIKLFWNKIFT